MEANRPCISAAALLLLYMPPKSVPPELLPRAPILPHPATLTHPLQSRGSGAGHTCRSDSVSSGMTVGETRSARSSEDAATSQSGVRCAYCAAASAKGGPARLPAAAAATHARPATKASLRELCLCVTMADSSDRPLTLGEGPSRVLRNGQRTVSLLASLQLVVRSRVSPRWRGGMLMKEH